MQLRRRPTLTPRQLREWLYQRGPSLSLGHCPYVIRTGRRAGETCGTPGHAQSHYSAYLIDAWRTEFGDEAEIPPWLELLRSGVSVFALDYDAILTAMSALPGGAESECHLCVQYDPGIEVAALGASEATALGASESASSGTAPAEALHTFTLESGATHCFFFCDSTALTPLSAPVVVSLADPSWGRVLARSTTVLPCPAVPSGSLTGFHLPSFSTNLVRNVVLQDQWVDTFTPGGQRVAICTCTQTGCHLATFTRRPGSSLYTLTTAPPQVAATGQVSASGQVASFSHQTLFWHHRLGHPSLPRLCDMHRRLLESSLPRSLPPLPASPTPPCLPCVEGRKRAAPHSSSFPPTEAPLQTLHLDVWGPVGVRGQGGDWFFLLVVDDYSRYTTLFPLRTKGEVPAVLIPWIRAVRLRLCRRFCQDLPVLRLHSDRGGEFTSDLLRAFCQGEGIEQSFTLPGSPQQNEVAERRIGLVMEVACTSLIHAAAPHLLWLFAVWYAAQQLNLWPRVSFARDLAHTALDRGGWQCVGVPVGSFFCLFPYRSAPPPPPPLFLAPGPSPVDPLPPQGPAPSGVSQVDPLLGPASVQVAVDSGAARGAASGGAESGGAEPGGAESEGAEPGGVATGGGEPRGDGPEGVEPGGAMLEGAEFGGAEPQGAASSGGSAGASPSLSPQQLREWFVRRTRLQSGASGAGGAGPAGAGGTGVAAGAGVTGGTATTGPGGARTRGTGAAGTSGVQGAGAGDLTESGTTGAGGAGAGGAGVGGPGAGGAGVGGPSVGGAGAGGAGAVDPGGVVRPRPYFVPLLQQVLGTPPSAALTPPLLCPPPDQSQPSLQSASPLPAPSPYTEQSSSLTERREPASRPVSPVRTARRVPRSRPPPVPGTHAMTLRPSSVPLRVPLPAPLESSLPKVPDPESDRARVASPTVSHLLATAVTDPSFESAAASALIAELLDFGATCRLDYATALVAESASASPLSVGGECALGTDVLEDRQEDFECLAAVVPRFASMLLALEGDPDAPDIPTPRSYAEAITGSYSSQWQAAMDAEMASWKSTGTYVDEVPPPGANIVDGM
ncbi:unnamed protein product [Closterium sp. NIES-53]